MFAKIAFLVFAGCATWASPVPDNANPLQGLSLKQLQDLQQQLTGTLQQTMQNVPQGLQGLPGQVANMPQQLAGTLQQGLQNLPPGLQGLSGQLANMPQQLTGTLQGLQNLPQGLQGLTGQLANMPQQTFQAVQQAVGELTERLGNGYVSTYDQQRESVHNTLNNVKDMGTKGVETGMSMVRNALELLFLLPKFGRNVLANGAQPQQQSWQQGQVQQRIY